MTFASSWLKIKLALGHNCHMPPTFMSEWKLEVFLLPLDVMVVHHRVRFKFASTHLYNSRSGERKSESEVFC